MANQWYVFTPKGFCPRGFDTEEQANEWHGYWGGNVAPIRAASKIEALKASKVARREIAACTRAPVQAGIASVSEEEWREQQDS